MPDQPSPTLTARPSSLASVSDLGISPSLQALPKPFARTDPSEEEKPAMKPPKHTAWNTAHLPLRITGDALSAASAAGLVAPFIMAVDRSIIENAAQKATITQSLRTSLTTLLTTPQKFFLSKPFALIFSLYFSTYFVANSLDTASSTLSPPASSSTASTKPDPRDPSTVTSGLPKFLATSATNLSLCVYKDTHFARMFGPAASSAARIPGASMALFAARDALTVFASFNVPPLLAPHLTLFAAESSRTNAAQFLAPAAVQLVSTPLHLLGLDLYNRGGASARERVRVIARDWAASCAARMGRIVPAFGLGGVVNAGVRREWMGGLASSKT